MPPHLEMIWNILLLEFPSLEAINLWGHPVKRAPLADPLSRLLAGCGAERRSQGSQSECIALSRYRSMANLARHAQGPIAFEVEYGIESIGPYLLA